MRLPPPDFCPDEINEIISSCFMENPEERPTFSDIAGKLKGKFEQLQVQEKSANENKGYLKAIQDTNLQHSEDLKTQYVEMKSQNKLSQKQGRKERRVKNDSSIEGMHDDTIDGIIMRKNSAYVNACFIPTEPEDTQPRNEDDLKFTDQKLYTSMCHETPLLNALSNTVSTPSPAHRPINLRRSSSQVNMEKNMDVKAVKATQSCNPLYMVMDQLEKSESRHLDDLKRNTICYV